MKMPTDMSELEAALDEREWRIIQGYEERVADALETIVRRGASTEEIRRMMRNYIYDDRVIRRIEPAARHLRRVKEMAQ